jgi:hypothetical protein
VRRPKRRGNQKKLTATQRRLVKEIGEICSDLGLDFYDIDEREPEARTAMLENAKRQIIRGEVVASYVLVDELLSAGLCRYFFGKRSFLSSFVRSSNTTVAGSRLHNLERGATRSCGPDRRRGYARRR